eukprot:gene6915-gene7605
MTWNPALYLKFQAPRLRPALDLLQAATTMVNDPTAVRSVLDLGCGPGNITPYLCQAFPNANIDGLDFSPEMIDKATKTSFSEDMKNRISFRVGTIEHEVMYNAKQYDIVYSNAALHWCEDHQLLLPRMLQKMISPNGGVLAIQMPDTIQQASHTLMETAALRSGNMQSIMNVRIPRTDHTADWYFRLLSPLCKDIDIWSSEYVQQLPATPKTYADRHDHQIQRHPVLEFTKSTGLQPLLQALGGEQTEKCQKFLNEYDRLLEEHYPTIMVKNKYHAKGKMVVLMPFKRFFLVCKT